MSIAKANNSVSLPSASGSGLRIIHKKVLVLEDDEDDFFVIKRVLAQALGDTHKVDHCDNIEKAIDLISVNTYDVVILDFFVGHVTAEKLIEKIQTEFPALPFLVVTGKGYEAEDFHSSDIEVLNKAALDPIELAGAIQFTQRRSAIIGNTAYDKQILHAPGLPTFDLESFRRNLDVLIMLSGSIKSDFKNSSDYPASVGNAAVLERIDIIARASSQLRMILDNQGSKSVSSANGIEGSPKPGDDSPNT